MRKAKIESTILPHHFPQALKRSCDKKMVAVERAKEETLKKIKREFDEKLRQKEIEVMRREKEIEVKIRCGHAWDRICVQGWVDGMLMYFKWAIHKRRPR